jgi:hypothetical protein
VLKHERVVHHGNSLVSDWDGQNDDQDEQNKTDSQRMSVEVDDHEDKCRR